MNFIGNDYQTERENEMKKIMMNTVISLGILCTPGFALGNETTATAVALSPDTEAAAEEKMTPGELTWSGDVSIKYERDTMEDSPHMDGLMYSLRLNAEKQLSPGFSLYARLGAQYATQPSLGDFNTDAYDVNKKGVIAIDLFGVTYKKGSFSYKLGRQDMTIGTTALLYSRSDTNIGIRNFVDGLTVEGKIGNIALTGVAVQEDNDGSADNHLYAIHGTYDVNERMQVGATLGRYIYADGSGQNTTNGAVDAVYKFKKSTFTAELAKSNADQDNKAYAVTWNYAFNDKTAVYVTAFRVEPYADMGQQSDFDNNNRGFYYGITHQLTKNDSVEVVYKDQKTLRDAEDAPSGSHNTKIEATLTHAF